MRALALILSSAAILLASRPAAADNYTSRSGERAAESVHEPAPQVVAEPAAVEPQEEPAPAPVFAPSEPTVAAAESAPAEPAPAAAPPGAVEPPPPPKLEKVWLNGALPEGAQTEGEWIWASDPAAGGVPAHSHPPAKGKQSHSFTAEPVEMPGNGMVVQQVWLDPQDPPQGIALRFKLASGEELGVYWEGEREVFSPTEYEELWYYGMLPELGRWTPLEILAEDLGLEDSRIAGITFATFDGRALWGRTILAEAPPLEGEEAEPAPEVPSDIRLTE